MRILEKSSRVGQVEQRLSGLEGERGGRNLRTSRYKVVTAFDQEPVHPKVKRSSSLAQRRGLSRNGIEGGRQ